MGGRGRCCCRAGSRWCWGSEAMWRRGEGGARRTRIEWMRFEAPVGGRGRVLWVLGIVHTRTHVRAQGEMGLID